MNKAFGLITFGCTTMSVSSAANRQARAVVRLFRTMMRLTREIPADVSLKGPIVEVREVTRDESFAVDNVEQLQQHIRYLFRRECTDVKTAIAQAVKGVQQLDMLLRTIRDQQQQDVSSQQQQQQQNTRTKQSDEALIASYVDEIKWLPSLLEESETQASVETSEGKSDDSSSSVFPMFPLSGPFYEPNWPLQPFFSHSYMEEIPTPGAEILLKIFEPRYRQMYDEMLTTGKKRFVVPFSHPIHTATYASTGLLYEVTSLREVADETNGVYQYVCNHLVTKPVRINKVYNPDVFKTQESYLQVEGMLVEDWQDESFPQVKEALERIQIDKHHRFAAKSLDALTTQGLWGFVRVWIVSLQEELVRLELQLSAQVRIVLTKEKDAAQQQRIIDQLTANRRQERLRLSFEIATLVPRLLQAVGTDEKTKVLLQIIEAESTRK